MPGTEKGDQGGQKGDQGAQDVRVKVGDKEYGAADVENLIKQTQAQGASVGAAATFLKTCERYGVSPEDFIANSEGALAVLGDLVEKGVIDNQGNLITKGKGDEGGDDALKGVNLPFPKEALVVIEQKVMDIVNKALDPLAKKVGTVESVQSGMLRGEFHQKIKSAHPELDDDDVSRVMAKAARDKSKGLFEHAADEAIKKKTMMESLRAAHAKEFGVDLKTFDQNKLLQQDPAGGVAARFKGLKFSFKRGEGRVAPSEGLRALMKANEQGG